MIANQKVSDSSGEKSEPKRDRKLLERTWDALLAEGFAEAVARRYVSWMRDYVLFHDKRHPQEMGVPEVRAFLEDARFSGQTGERVEAAAAIRFLYEGKPNAVYLNGRQQGVKLLDRVRNALRVPFSQCP